MCVCAVLQCACLRDREASNVVQSMGSAGLGVVSKSVMMSQWLESCLAHCCISVSYCGAGPEDTRRAGVGSSCQDTLPS